MKPDLGPRAQRGDIDFRGWSAADVLRRWIEQYGVPHAHALYTDWKNIYVRPPNAEETATGAVPYHELPQAVSLVQKGTFLFR